MIEYWALNGPPKKKTKAKAKAKERTRPMAKHRTPKRGAGGRFLPARRNPTGHPFSGSSYRPRVTRKAGSIVSQLQARIEKIAGMRRKPRRKSAARTPVVVVQAPRPRRSSRRATTVIERRAARRPRRSRSRSKRRTNSRRRRSSSRRRRNSPRRYRSNPGFRELLVLDTWVGAGQGALGFAAALTLPHALAKALGKPQLAEGWAGVGASAATTALTSMLASFAGFERLGRNLMVGGLIATLIRGVVAVWPQAAAQFVITAAPRPTNGVRLPARPAAPGAPQVPTGTSGFGNYLMDQQLMRRRGMRDYVNVESIQDYVNVESIQGDNDDDGSYMDLSDRDYTAGMDDYLTAGGTDGAFSAEEVV